MKGEKIFMPKDILVVDCQYDFIDGSLACGHSEEAVKNIIAFINANPGARVFYSADWHSLNTAATFTTAGRGPYTVRQRRTARSFTRASTATSKTRLNVPTRKIFITRATTTHARNTRLSTPAASQAANSIRTSATTFLSVGSQASSAYVRASSRS